MAKTQQYHFLDSGGGRKLEKFGDFILIRPCPQAMWNVINPKIWDKFDAEFVRTTEEKGEWQTNPSGPNQLYTLPKNWLINSKNGLVWTIEPNDFGNLGVFCEHWEYVENLVNFFENNTSKQDNSEKTNNKTKNISSQESSEENNKENNKENDDISTSFEENENENFDEYAKNYVKDNSNKTNLNNKFKILNLFTYSGSSCIWLVKQGFSVTAVDSSRSAMDLYNLNFDNNKLSREGQRMILEDVDKFVDREIRREAEYDGIMIDAPSYGRGRKGELFKIEEHLVNLLKKAKNLLKKDGKLVLTLHSPRFTPAILSILVGQLFEGKKVETSEIMLKCQNGIDLPSGFLVKVG